MTRTVAVTGATGGLGRALVAELVAAGWAVRAGVRTDKQAALARSLGAEPVSCDVTAPASLGPLVAGVEVVHHLAAWMGSPAGRAEAVNVIGTQNLLAAAASAGVMRVVLALSLIHIS